MAGQGEAVTMRTGQARRLAPGGRRLGGMKAKVKVHASGGVDWERCASESSSVRSPTQKPLGRKPRLSTQGDRPIRLLLFERLGGNT